MGKVAEPLSRQIATLGLSHIIIKPKEVIKINSHRVGRLRDSAILQAIDEQQVLDTEQLRLMFFRGMANGQRLAQRRLAALCAKGRLKRARESFDQPYYYYRERKSNQAAHRIGVNWARLWLTLGMRSWETLQQFDYEQDYGVLRTDGFATVRNKVTGKHRFCFIEFDNHLSGNAFDKVQKYNTLYERQPVVWWADFADRFPAIMVVTTGRAKHIREKVATENTNGLEFRVYDLAQIKEECGSGYSDKS